MTDLNTALPPALRRALELLADPPAEPDVSKGYLDLLGADSGKHSALPKNTGAIQALWASPGRVTALRQRPGAVAPVSHRLAASH